MPIVFRTIEHSSSKSAHQDSHDSVFGCRVFPQSAGRPVRVATTVPGMPALITESFRVQGRVAYIPDSVLPRQAQNIGGNFCFVTTVAANDGHQFIEMRIIMATVETAHIVNQDHVSGNG